MFVHVKRYRRLLTIVAAAIIAGAAIAGASLATSTSSSATDRTVAGAALQGSFVNVVQSVSPSVVQIEDETGLGSGIVFDPRGDIVTNNHVVTGATAFTVTTSTGKRYPAKLVGAFPPDDIAVIRVSGAGLKPATFADSSTLQVGDLTIAIGNPLGLQSSVTNGIVSAFRQATQEPNNVTLPSGDPDERCDQPGQLRRGPRRHRRSCDRDSDPRGH
jgi:putative serine protease PepD